MRSPERDSERYAKLQAREDSLIRRMLSDAKKLETVRAKVRRLKKAVERDADCVHHYRRGDCIHNACSHAPARSPGGGAYPRLTPEQIEAVHASVDRIAASPLGTDTESLEQVATKALGKPVAFKSGPLDFACGTCAARPGSPCSIEWPEGKIEETPGHFHAARKRAAGRQS